MNRTTAAVIIMTLGVIAVYLPQLPGPGQMVLSGDFHQLHERRMRFARDAIFDDHILPAWYSRELLGTPFRANIQNFPFIPTRLLIVLTLDPSSPLTYPIMAMLSAVLAARFTFLYCRRIGIENLGAAVGGWTFACSGYYASRVAAGHLPLLEAYPALPLLLWTIESLLRDPQHAKRWMLALGLSAACISLAGHPQIPIYTLAAAAIYAFWRTGLKPGARALIALFLGVGCAAFALLPMMLLIGRSTRVLPLESAENDVTLPVSMLANFFFPFAHGFAPPLPQAPKNLFHGYPNFAWFWDTFCYIGWMPWIALVLLAAIAIRTKPNWRIAGFFIVAGLLGVILALPFTRQLVLHISSGTLLRSPARLLYLTEFSLALVLAVAVNFAVRFVRHDAVKFLLVGAIAIHVIDLWWHDRVFIAVESAAGADEESLAQLAAERVGDGRAAFDYLIPAAANRTVDDVGAFDSILLARPYRFLLELTGAPTDLNVQFLDGWQLSRRALQAAGVKVVVAQQENPEFEKVAQVGRLKLFKVEPTASRAAFFSPAQTSFGTAEQIHETLRDRRTDAAGTLMLPLGAPQPPREATGSADVRYHRASSDVIQCDVTAPHAGYLRVIESWDPGWTATVDGVATTVYPAWDALLAVPVPAGGHRVEFVYRTPGARAGAIVSICCVLGLAIFAMAAGRSASA